MTWELLWKVCIGERTSHIAWGASCISAGTSHMTVEVFCIGLRMFHIVSRTFHVDSRVLKECSLKENYQWIPPSLLRNFQKLSPSPGNGQRIPLGQLRNSQKLTTTSRNFFRNFLEAIEKFTEIVHDSWEIAKKFPWAYHAISKNCPLVLWNSHRIPLRLLRNYQKISTSPGKLENFHWAYWAIPGFSYG